jgi:hypothetical protein
VAARALPPGGPGPQLPGLDPRFDASVEAQIGLLEQAIIGDEIAPGDPLNYPMPWLRDGAYALVAMSRSGQTARVRVLARPFAKRDYFGGFGAEADAPGLALWALGEASVAVDDPTFDRSLWTDVVRKVSLIERLLAAREPVRAPYSGSIVPRLRYREDLDLVADPSRGGLIQGRMDWQRPVFYVNAVTVAGLESASRMAARLGHAPEAAAWRGKPAICGWRGAWPSPQPHLWTPSAITIELQSPACGPERSLSPRPSASCLRSVGRAPGSNLQGPSVSLPLWTYFALAEAHQWLRLRRPERAWSTMTWFWDHEPAPGLYTLWEGDGEENSFGLWRGTRGWVQPGGVTPHYWSAAEMLLLQLAMLAEVEGPSAERVLTIGSGVPASWFHQPFSVSGIGTSAGPVAWSWNGRVVTVRTAADLPVQLGPSFPADAKLRVVQASGA